jgi:hypothetical protein
MNINLDSRDSRVLASTTENLGILSGKEDNKALVEGTE